MWILIDMLKVAKMHEFGWNFMQLRLRDLAECCIVLIRLDATVPRLIYYGMHIILSAQ